MDRSRDLTSVGDLLFKEVLSTFYINDVKVKVKPATYGICGTEITPGDIIAIFETLKEDKNK